MDWSTLLTSVKDFRDFVFRPLTLFTFSILALTLLILPKSFLTWLGLATPIEQARGKISIAMIVLFAVGFIQTCLIYLSPWMSKKKQRKKDREGFKHKLDTLSKYELLILAYCLSRNRITFFVQHHGRNQFENAVESLRANGLFELLPGNTQGYPYYITGENWSLLQHFREYILNKSEALFPQYEREFEFYDTYQKAFGFEQAEIPTKKKEIASQSADLNYTLYTKDVFLELMWKWNYKPEFDQKPLNLTPHCPDCEQQLLPKPDLDGKTIFTDRITGKHHKRVVCSVHRKDYRIQVDEQGDYVTVIADISKKIKNGKWKEIVDQQKV